MPDFSEIQDFRARQPKSEAMVAHERMRQAVVLRMEALVASDPWETYRAHLEALYLADQTASGGVQDRMIQGELVGDALTKALLELRYLRGRLDAWRQAMDLPLNLRAEKALDTAPGQA